jgi:hypothetical protein
MPKLSPCVLAGGDAQAATIVLERPVGRFTSGKLRCPPTALDRRTSEVA